MRIWFLVTGLVYGFSASAVVDMKTANFADTWVDLIVPNSGYDLKVSRTYNSRTLYSGIFGFGWCSDFETRLEITPESALKIVECGAGAEVLYTPKKFDQGRVDDTINSIMSEVKKRNSSLSSKELTELKNSLKDDYLFREEFARRVGLKGSVSADTVFYASGRENETITRQAQNYKRTLADGTFQLFDLNGRLTHMYDRNNNYLKLSYSNDAVSLISDNDGNKLTLRYDPNTRKVSKITGPNRLTVDYVTRSEDLIRVKNAWKETFSYEYDDLHNLTKITMPDGKTKQIGYNKDKDWVTSFTNTVGCKENYEYKADPNDPKNHFWSTVVKRCGKEITNKSSYEFVHRPRKDGFSSYLYRVRSDNNGSITDITYHEIFGKPVAILRGNMRTEYTYYDNGLVRTKKEGPRFLTFEYKNTCGKVSKVDIEYSVPASERSPSDKGNKKDSVPEIKKVRTHFTYEPKKCNLILAQNSDGQKVKLQYDVKGRIAVIEDQSKKLVKIQYDSRFGKPAVVSRPGLGTINVSYKASGEIDKVDSKDGPRVAVQVASIFSNLLEIIAPASAETNL